MLTAKYKEIAFTDQDVVNPGDFIPNDEYNPHKVHAWLIHDHGFVLAVVFADCPLNALDIAADAGKLDHFKIDLTDKNDRNDYLSTEVPPGFDPGEPEFVDSEGINYWWKDEPTFPGNAGEPFDLDLVDCVSLPNPPFSFVALFNALQENHK